MQLPRRGACQGHLGGGGKGYAPSCIHDETASRSMHTGHASMLTLTITIMHTLILALSRKHARMQTHKHAPFVEHQLIAENRKKRTHKGSNTHPHIYTVPS